MVPTFNGFKFHRKLTEYNLNNYTVLINFSKEPYTLYTIDSSKYFYLLDKNKNVLIEVETDPDINIIRTSFNLEPIEAITLLRTYETLESSDED